jgi:hypothetical protein
VLLLALLLLLLLRLHQRLQTVLTWILAATVRLLLWQQGRQQQQP